MAAHNIAADLLRVSNQEEKQREKELMTKVRVFCNKISEVAFPGLEPNARNAGEKRLAAGGCLQACTGRTE